MVASDGRSVSPEHSSSIENFAIPHSVAFAGDAFYAATSAATSSNPYQLRLKRIETDGSFTTVIDALPGVMANVPMVVPGAGDLRVVFANNPGSVNSAIGFMLQKLDERGAALGPATPLDATNRHGQVTPLAMGADTVALLSAGSGNALEMTRIGATGAVATPAFIVAQWPPHNGYQLAMARRGSEVLVAWGPGLRGPGIRIARVTP